MIFFFYKKRISPVKLKLILLRRIFECFWSFGIGKSAGVAIFISPNFSGKIIRYVHDTDGRVLSLLVNYNSFKFNVMSLCSKHRV